MTPEQFAYWFQGFAELSPTPPTQEQWDSIREHLALVFENVTSFTGLPKPTRLAPPTPTHAPSKQESDSQNPLTPKPETESEMLKRLIRQYEEAQRNKPFPNNWTPDRVWPYIPPRYYGIDDLPPGTLFC